jgi:hypothetical protein
LIVPPISLEVLFAIAPCCSGDATTQ